MPRNKEICLYNNVNELWSSPNIDLLDNELKVKYEARKEAVDLYIEGEKTINEIEQITGINHSEIIRFYKKCLTCYEDGSQVGYYGLIPYKRAKEKNEERSNSMTALFKRYPEIKEEMLNFYFRNAMIGANRHPQKIDAFKELLKSLDYEGLRDDEYPYMLKDKGRKAFYKWLDEMEKSEIEFAMAKSDADARTLYKTTGVLNPVFAQSQRPYQAIEIDGHKIDAFYAEISIDKDGFDKFQCNGRPWLLAAIDVATRAIVSFRIIFDEAYNADDVLKLIEGIVRPMNTENIRNLANQEGFPSVMFEEAKWALPNIIKLDNAMAHLSKDVISKIKSRKVKFQFGPVNTPVSRPHIERFFGTLEKDVIRKIPSACGNNPSEPIRINSENEAVRHEITAEKLEYIISNGISDYNSKHVLTTTGRTPMGAMKAAFDRGLVPNHLSLNSRGDDFNFNTFKTVTVRGNPKKGRAPYIQTNGFRYTSELLVDGPAYVGQKLIIEVDPDDITTVLAYSERTNKPLGPLFIKGTNLPPKMSLRTAKSILKLSNEARRSNETNPTTTDQIVKTLAAGKKSKKKTRELNRFLSELTEQNINEKVPNFEGLFNTGIKPGFKDQYANDAIEEEISESNYTEIELDDVLSEF